MKNHIYYFSILFFISVASACTSKTNESDNINTETIYIEVPEKFVTINFDEYFSDFVLIPLETNEKVLIQQIDRIVRDDEKMYILDRGTNSVLVFHDDGRFDCKIQAEGRGPGEYESLTDFTIDKSTGNIVLYSDRPYKLLVYSSKGEFIKEERLTNSYDDIAYLNGKLLFVNRDEALGSLLIERDIETKNEKDYLPITEPDIFYASIGSPTPQIVDSRNVYITFPYSNVVYEYTDEGAHAKYILDFGDKTLSDELPSNGEDPVVHYTNLLMDNYGIGISNFSEKDNLIAFTYGAKTMALYNKDTKDTKSFNVVKGAGPLMFDNFFAHDGDDNTLISIVPASKFKVTMDRYRSDPKIWSKISQRTKMLADKIRVDDNSLLLIYTLK